MPQHYNILPQQAYLSNLIVPPGILVSFLFSLSFYRALSQSQIDGRTDHLDSTAPETPIMLGSLKKYAFLARVGLGKCTAPSIS